MQKLLHILVVISCALVGMGGMTVAEADSKIAFVSNRDGNTEIYVMNADGSNQTNLTNHSSEYRKFKPRICRNVRYWKLCQIDKRGETRPLPGKLLVDRLYPMLNRHEVASAEGEAITIRWEAEMKQAATELQQILGTQRNDEAEHAPN